MKNAEKYVEQIAGLIAKSDAVCEHFVDLELTRCSYCPLHGVCCNKDKLTEWLLQEVCS